MKSKLIKIGLVLVFGFAAITADAQTVYYRDLAKQGLLKVSPQCGQFLKKFYQDGKRLSSGTIRRLSKPLAEFRFDNNGVRLDNLNPVFYNYSFGNYTFGSSLEKRFYELKQLDLHYEISAMFKAALYLSQDPISSKTYGPNLLKLRLSPKTQVIYVPLYPTDGFVWDEVIDEMLGKYGASIFKFCEFSVIKPLIFEDSGVHLILYWIAEYPGISGFTWWFQLLNTSTIENQEFNLNVN